MTRSTVRTIRGNDLEDHALDKVPGYDFLKRQQGPGFTQVHTKGVAIEHLNRLHRPQQAGTQTFWKHVKAGKAGLAHLSG